MSLTPPLTVMNRPQKLRRPDGQILRVLQIFSRYIHYGGEEGSVYRIGDALQEICDVEYFFESTQSLLRGTAFDRAMIPLKVWRNQAARDKLRRLHRIGRFDLWQVHNVFPALSPAVYQEAFDRGVPILHYLHNYRMSCVNGFFLNHGKPCTTCINGNFWNAALTGCWHESHVVSALMGFVVSDLRRMGVFEKIAQWVAISEAQKKLHVRMGIPADRIEVVPHFYEAPDSTPPFPAKGKALFLGRVSKEKGLEHLIEAWGEADRQGHELVVAGEGEELDAIMHHAASMGLKGIQFSGFLGAEELKTLWHEISFLVVPSIWQEPFGMVVLEAWAHARPVVAYANGSLPELITHRETGLLVAPRDRAGLGAAVLELIEDPAQSLRMGMAGYECLRQRYNKTSWLAHLSRLYSKIIVGNSPG